MSDAETAKAGTGIADRLGRIGPGLRKVLGNMSWLMMDRVVRMGMGLFVGVWVARYLGPERFGSLNFAIAFIALFGTVTTLGLDGIVMREVLHSPEEAHEILGTTLALRSGCSLLGAIASIAVVRWAQPHDREALVLVSILSLTLVFQAFDTIDSFFQSQVRSRITVWAKNGAFLVFAGIRVALICAKEPLWTFAAASTGEAVLGAVGLVIGYRLYGGRMILWQSSRKRAAKLLQQSWPVIFSGMAIMVYMRLDMIMLKVMRGDFEVGLYSAATRISEVWYFIPSVIVSSVSPAIMKAKGDRKIFLNRMRKLFSLITVTALVIGSAVALCSRFIIHALYTSSYSGAAPVLAVHVWASIFVFFGVAQSPWDITDDLLKILLYRTIAGAIINIAINLVLIPKYGALGAAIATVVAYAAAVLANAFSAKTRPILWMQIQSFIPTKFWNITE